MKLFEVLAVSSSVIATDQPELDDIFYNKCQAAHLESQGYKVDPKMIIEDDCDMEDVRAASSVYSKWTNMWDPEENKYIIPYYYAEGYADLSYPYRGVTQTGVMSMAGINKNVAHFETLTCLKMKLITEAERDEYESVIRVHWDDPDKRCSSGIGRCTGICEISMRPDCHKWHSETTVNHEFMHRLGFRHEHTRPDRDEWVSIHPNLVDESNYRKLPLSDWEDLESPYDFRSILHYTVKTEDDGLPTIGIASDPSIGAPVNRQWPMSDQDAFQLNAFHACEINDKCADAGEDRCGGSRHKCLNQPIGYTCECADGYNLVTNAEEIQTCVRDGSEETQYTIRMEKINEHLTRLIDNLEKTRYTNKYTRKMLKKIEHLDAATNEDKFRCDGSDRPDGEGEDVSVFDGETNCKLASQINSALVSASRKWACRKGSASRLVRHFNKYNRQFQARMCSDE